MKIVDADIFETRCFFDNFLKNQIDAIENVSGGIFIIDGVSGKTTLFNYMSRKHNKSSNPYIMLDTIYPNINLNDDELCYYIQLQYFKSIFKWISNVHQGIFDNYFNRYFLEYEKISLEFSEYLMSREKDKKFPYIDYSENFEKLKNFIQEVKNIFNLETLNLIVDDYHLLDSKIQEKISVLFYRFDKVLLSCNNKENLNVIDFDNSYYVYVEYSENEIDEIIRKRIFNINKLNVYKAASEKSIYGGILYQELDYEFFTDSIHNFYSWMDYDLNDIFEVLEDFNNQRHNSDIDSFNKNDTLVSCVKKIKSINI